MANNTKYTGLTNYANYHTFSKLQVGNNVNFGGSINRSGHTVTNTDAWLDDVPFFNTFTTPSAALAAVGKSTVQNDLISIAVAEGDIATGIYRRNNIDNADGSKSFNEIFVPYTIGTDKDETGATVLLNKNGKAVVRVWTGQQLTLLDGDNNSNANSEGQAARIIIDGAPVEQFIAVPDVCRSGYPSNGYSIKVYNDGTPMTMDFGTVTNTFFDVPFAGVIMFGGGTDGSVYTIDCFEYIGDKLAAVNTKIADIQETIENLTVEAGEGIKQIKTVEGSGITVATEGVEGATKLTPVIDIDTTVIATKESVDAIAEDVSEIQQTIESGVVSTVTASSAAQTAGITVGGTDTEPEIQVTVGEVSASSNAVVTGKAVATALSEAQAAIKVTTDDHATRIGKLESNEAGYATTTEVATAKSEAIAAAKTETETQVGAAKSEIKTTTDDHETRIAAIEDSYATSQSVTTLGNTSLAAASTTEETYQVKVSTTGTVATGLSITVDTKDIASAAALSALDTKVTEHIELAAGTYLEVEVVDSLDSVTEPKTNKLYLVPNTGKGNNVKDEYIYTNNSWELIGTTEVDLTPYAKTADVNAGLALKADQTALDSTNTEVAKKANIADVYTKTEINAAQETTDAAIEAAAAKGQQGITDAATAKTAADAAQAAADAAQAAATQALTNAATAKTAADAAQEAADTAQAAADAAQGEVDDLEGVVSALSQVVADNKTAADQTQTDLDDLEEKVAALDAIISGGASGGGTLAEMLAAKLDKSEYETNESARDEEVAAIKATADSAIQTASGDTYVSLSKTGTEVAATTDIVAITTYVDTEVAKDASATMTAVATAISSSATTTLNSAKAYTEEQVEALATELNAGEVSADNTAVSVTQTNGKITAVTVTKGAIADRNPNLVDGGTVYAVTSAIETRLSKVETAADTGVDSKITAAIEALDATPNGNGITVTQVDGVITAVAAADGEVAENNKNVVTGGVVHAAITKAISDQAALDAAAYATKTTEIAAQTAQTTAEAKVQNITTEDGRITLTPTTENKVKSVEIALAETVATVDGADDTAGTVYTKAQVDEMVGGAKPENYVTTVKVGENETSGEVTVEVEAKTEATHFGSELISASLTGSKVTINAAPAKEWSVSDVTESLPSIASITSVINGKMSNGSTIDDANLIDGTAMFAGNIALTTYVGDLGKLTNGAGMFAGCSALTTFCGNLGSLTMGIDMFSGCALDEESLIYIIDSLPVVESGTITVGVATGVDKTPYVTEAATKGWALV